MTDGETTPPTSSGPNRNLIWDRLRSPLEHLGTLAACAAAAISFIYLTGGAVMSIRFEKAGLPAAQAIAALPREVLLVAGLRSLLLPSIVAGLLFSLLGRFKAQLLSRSRAVSGTPRSSHQLLYLSLAIAILVLTTPISLSGFAWLGAFAAVALYDWTLTRRWMGQQTSSRFPAHRVGIAALTAVALVTIALELGGPAVLEKATILTREGRTIEGYYVSSRQQEGVYLAVGAKIVITPHTDVKSVSLERPVRQRSRQFLFSRLWPDPKSSYCPGAPNVKVPFTAETHIAGVNSRGGASQEFPVIGRFAGSCKLGFVGYCLGDTISSAFIGTPDARWFVLPNESETRARCECHGKSDFAPNAGRLPWRKASFRAIEMD